LLSRAFSLYPSCTNQVAVKTLRDTDMVNLFEDAEIRLLQRARHPRLVMFVGAGYIDNDEKRGIFVVMEYMNYGSLTSFLHDKSRRFEEKLPLLKDVAEGMEFLHSVCKALHRDLKSDNCLLVKNPKTGTIRCKVGDFGLSRFSQPQTSSLRSKLPSSSFSTQESSSKTRRKSSLKDRMNSTWCSSARISTVSHIIMRVSLKSREYHCGSLNCTLTKSLEYQRLNVHSNTDA